MQGCSMELFSRWITQLQGYQVHCFQSIKPTSELFINIPLQWTNLVNHTQTKPINRLFIKTKIMKKIFALAFIAAGFTACNDADTDTTSVDTDTTTTTMTTTRTYTAAEGDVSYRNEN